LCLLFLQLSHNSLKKSSHLPFLQKLSLHSGIQVMPTNLPTPPFYKNSLQSGIRVMPTKFDLWPMATLLFNLWPMATLLSSNMIGLFIGYLLPTPARRWLNTDSSGWYYSKIIKLLRFSNLKIMFSKRIFGL
jgi:hypothetical protein